MNKAVLTLAKKLEKRGFEIIKIDGGAEVQTKYVDCHAVEFVISLRKRPEPKKGATP